MRQDPQEALYRKHPAIFRQKDLPETVTCMCRGIECDDGWYVIIDSLCCVLEAHAALAGHPVVAAVQVKQKFGTLRFSVDDSCPWCEGAVEFAEIVSGHVCEASGRPGTAVVRKGWCRTLADDLAKAGGFVPVDDVVPVPLEPDLPRGWQTLAGALAQLVAHVRTQVTLRFSTAGGMFAVDGCEDDEWVSGAVAAARALAERTDPGTSQSDA